MALLDHLLDIGPKRSRRARVAVEGSPSFRFASPAIGANGTWVINLESNTDFTTQIAKYLPLDFIEVVNNQAEILTLTINDVNDYTVLGNVSRIVQDRPVVAVKLLNTSANAIAAGTIVVHMERKPATADSEARRGVAQRT